MRIESSRRAGLTPSRMWEAVVGEKVTRPERFVQALFDASEGRLAYLYDIIGQLDAPRREFLLGGWIADPAARLDRFRQLATTGIAAFRDWHVRTLPHGRATHDLAAAVLRLEGRRQRRARAAGVARVVVAAVFRGRGRGRSVGAEAHRRSADRRRMAR